MIGTAAGNKVFDRISQLLGVRGWAGRDVGTMRLQPRGYEIKMSIVALSVAPKGFNRPPDADFKDKPLISLVGAVGLEPTTR